MPRPQCRRRQQRPSEHGRADAVDFVGWYHSKTADTYGVAKNDTYRLYIAYYLGWNGFKRGNWPSSVQAYARSTDDMARRYAAQLQQCGG